MPIPAGRTLPGLRSMPAPIIEVVAVVKISETQLDERVIALEVGLGVPWSGGGKGDVDGCCSLCP